MSVSPMVRGSSGYVLTELGHLALKSLDSCACCPKLAGLLLVCPICDTVFAHLKDTLIGGSAHPKRD